MFVLLLGLSGSWTPQAQATVPSGWEQYKVGLHSHIYGVPNSVEAHMVQLIASGYEAVVFNDYYRTIKNHTRVINNSFEDYSGGWLNWTHTQVPDVYNEYVDEQTSTPLPIPDGSYVAHFALNTTSAKYNTWQQAFQTAGNKYAISMATHPLLNVSLYFEEMSNKEISGPDCFVELRLWIQSSPSFYMKFTWYGDDTAGWNVTNEQTQCFWIAGQYSLATWLTYSFNLTKIMEDVSNVWKVGSGGNLAKDINNFAVCGVEVRQYTNGNNRVEVYVDNVQVYGTLSSEESYLKYKSGIEALSNATIRAYAGLQLWAMSDYSTTRWMTFNQSSWVEPEGSSFQQVSNALHNQGALIQWGYVQWDTNDKVYDDPQEEAYGVDFFENYYLDGIVARSMTTWNDFLKNGTKIFMISFEDCHTLTDYDKRGSVIAYAPDDSLNSLAISLKNGYFYTRNASWTGTLLFETSIGHPTGRNIVYSSGKAELKVAITSLQPNLKLCLVRNGTYFENVTLASSGSYTNTFLYTITNDCYYRAEVRNTSLSDPTNIVALSQPIFFRNTLLDNLCLGLDYVTNSQTAMSSVSYSANKLSFTVSAPSATTSTTKVYCAGKGKPPKVWSTGSIQSQSWDETSKVETVSVLHGSSETVILDWTGPEAGPAPTPTPTPLPTLDLSKMRDNAALLLGASVLILALWWLYKPKRRHQR